MDANKLKQKRRQRRKTGIRKRVAGTPMCPRLTVYRSLKHIYVQIIDDLEGKTLVSASSRESDFGSDAANGGNQAGAIKVGQAIAEKAKAAGIQTIAFDRNGFRYHGRIKALAESVREQGLRF